MTQHAEPIIRFDIGKPEGLAWSFMYDAASETLRQMSREGFKGFRHHYPDSTGKSFREEFNRVFCTTFPSGVDIVRFSIAAAKVVLLQGFKPKGYVCLAHLQPYDQEVL